MPADPSFGRLADLAMWHDHQADPFKLFQSRATYRAHKEAAALYSRMLGNRAAADPNRLTLIGTMPLDAPGRWCQRHGYKCIATSGTAGVIAQRGGETPLIARLGDTLLWDGERITVLERP